jgi:rSAM/selenodomain-associated transferase 1
MDVPIVVFAKAPVPGEAKTRLIPALGADGAAALHARLVGRALDTARAVSPGAVELCCAPDAAHPFFAGCAAALGVSLEVQGSGDLGARMHRALARTLAAAERAVLIGADAPALSPAYLREAAAALGAGADVVLGPAADGGYVLIGARRVVPALFDAIPWGSPEVLAAQRARLHALGWRWTELGTLWDVDRPADLERVRREIAGGRELLEGRDA